MQKGFLFFLLITMLFSDAFASQDVSIEEAIDENPLTFHAFFNTDITFSDTNNQIKLTSTVLDLYVTKSLTDNLNILLDVAIEGDSSEVMVDLERLKLVYNVNEYINITGGKFHTPYGYWNTAFHHGVQLQTSILRPKFIAFEDEGGILPSHSIGGIIDATINNFTYTLYLTTGAYIDESVEDNVVVGTITANDSLSNANPMLGFNIAYTVEDTKVGIHGLTGDVETLNKELVRLNMMGGFIAHESDKLEFYAEAYIFFNRNENTPDSDNILQSHNYFGQVAYGFDKIKPYARIEYAHYNEEDLYFASQKETAGGSYIRGVVGLNYSLSENINIKIALLKEEDRNSKIINTDVLFQLAVGF